MGTSLTPEFYERFALLLVAAMGATFVLTMLFDALALRRARRHGQTPPTLPPSVPPTRLPHSPVGTDHPTRVGC
ncbi:hypothetical protein ABZZ74_51410 [Streptomyces sp. NPDC006476]|uniref:hypothetical protein n=1 Tax=Streptomyces sp. NPDC006476 TaxID=3157175 RepID=UPI0033A87042